MVASMSGGDLAQWAGVAVVLLVCWRITRGGGGSAVQELSEANRVLTKAKEELGGQVRDLLIENTSLRHRTDYAAVMERHERQAQERHVATLKVLDLIAKRLGPDPNGEHADARAA